MRKTIIIFLAALSFGCKKSSDSGGAYCWTCKFYNNSDFIDVASETNLCGKSQSDITAYEKANTKYKTTYNGSNNQQTLVQSVFCTKQ